MKRCGGWGIVHAKVEHAPPNSLDWAESGFTITVMPDGLTPDGILLVGER